MNSVKAIAAFGLLASLVTAGCEGGEESPNSESFEKGPDSTETSTEKPTGTDGTNTPREGGANTGTKPMGKDCAESSECADKKCVTFVDNSGTERGFCSRRCVKAADCPDGWDCSISPYMACVPAED